MSSLPSSDPRTANGEPWKSAQPDLRNSENEHFASIANRLVDYINDVILTRRLGTKPTVVNTKWPWHLSILPWIPDRLLLFIHVFVLRIVQSTSTNLSRGFYMIKPASRKAMVSNTTNIEVCDRHTRHRWGTYNCTLYTNLQLEEKPGNFNAT